MQTFKNHRPNNQRGHLPDNQARQQYAPKPGKQEKSLCVGQRTVGLKCNQLAKTHHARNGAF